VEAFINEVALYFDKMKIGKLFLAKIVHERIQGGFRSPEIQVMGSS
jgi:hypothetical protein